MAAQARGAGGKKAVGTPAAVVWLHGLGDSGRGWADLEKALGGAMPFLRWCVHLRRCHVRELAPPALTCHVRDDCVTGTSQMRPSFRYL